MRYMCLLASWRVRKLCGRMRFERWKEEKGSNLELSCWLFVDGGAGSASGRGAVGGCRGYVEDKERVCAEGWERSVEVVVSLLAFLLSVCRLETVLLLLSPPVLAVPAARKTSSLPHSRCSV